MQAAQGDPMPEPELHEVAPGVYAYVQPDGSWMLNNTGLVTAPPGAAPDTGYVLVDTTSTESRNRALLRRVRDVAGDGPPRVLVNTHHHGDHTFGNWLMPPRTPIVGHVLCRADVERSGTLAARTFTGPDYGELRVRPPDTTFESRLTLHLGERRIDLLHTGPAHTRGDVIVWLPAERVAFAGDLAFSGGQPFLVDGSVAGYPAALAALCALAPAVLVPGHGPISRGDDVPRLLGDLLEYSTVVEHLARYGHKAGVPPLELARGATRELGRFATWRESERLVGNLHRAYFELDGNAPGSHLPMADVWADMVAYHGGPIPCHA
ncbi:MBL fold metallo-hydrolase [Spongiactinospora sp. TRM90649]|uniref:MBL fold metallo-hydrolase n=1 Tax=Spongiactinospora sp. TRM90649 TaxID=3031114 RepID=UPI0023F97EC6|nr:MBL fold metallo-hydrolase [Spongiactinospora sp. TRM90649]MDF5755617.1 MBL fold metallo-hydrolase [Spongiactinospora sp. TRM90649]